MTSKFGFLKMTIQEFEDWISLQKIARTVLTIQQHHTLIPTYAQFSGSNHFELQQGMKNHHVHANGWNDIGQHFTTFPDGSILTGRSLEKSPACIIGQNANDICIEHIGNFDIGKDSMNTAHWGTTIRITAKLCNRFNLPVNSNSIIYHHWFDLVSGNRNNGTHNNKSCPGSNFFGGNKVINCEMNFLPLISQRIQVQKVNAGSVRKYVITTAPTLNIRSLPDASSAKITSREAASLGAVLRVYDELEGWYKISNSQQHWVAAKHTLPVLRATVTRNTLNVRSGPGKAFDKIGAFTKGQELFVVQKENGWYKVSMDHKWVNEDYLTII